VRIVFQISCKNKSFNWRKIIKIIKICIFWWSELDEVSLYMFLNVAEK